MMTLRPVRAGRVSITSLVASLTLMLVAMPAPAQGPARTATKFYPDSSDTADALLRNGASHVRDGQWAEAVDIYQRVIQQFGDKVARLPKDDEASDPTGESVLFVDLRQFCQRRLAALPPEARALYRGRVDAQAERWYRQGAADRDRSALRRVVDQAFCSSWGDDALDLLGDLAFEDGRFDEALSMYRQLVPDREGDRIGLRHPDPSVDLARVAAKKVLCRAALGEPPPDAPALEAFAAAYPEAAGTLAGRTGPYAKILAEALRADGLAPTAQSDGRWPTFAGSPTRTKVVPGAIDVGSLQWRVGLTAFDPNRRAHGMGFRMGMPMAPAKVPDDRILCYFPIVLGDQVIVCNESKIQAFDLNDRPEGTAGPSGGSVQPVWEAPPDNQEAPIATATAPSSTVPRYTLTAFGDRIYARLGPPNSPFIGMGRGAFAGAPSQSKIVAVDRGTEGKVLWTKPAGDVVLPNKRPAEGTNRTGFEGTPVADARHVYVAMTDRREQTATYVACLDAETGASRWVRYLGAASADGDNFMGFGMGMGMGMATSLNDFGHRLLTLDGPTIYYQTNLGAVVALDAETGAIRWVATYPRSDRSEGASGHDRDLNPAIVHDGLVIVAPDDATSIYAFDAGSGRLVWKTDPLPGEVKLAHLLGVAKGRLVATGDRVLLFDVRTGKLVTSWPDSGHVFEGFGRGVLAGDRIYWPTRTEIHVLDQATGLRAEPPIKLQESFQTTGGNLAVGDGYLIVAQADALVVFCQNSRLIQRYRDEIARDPGRASSHFRLAKAAEATGQDELALESLAMTIKAVRPSESIDGISLADAARDNQYRLLMRLGQKARADRDWAGASGRFEAAAASARSDRDRLAARLLYADAQLGRGRPGDAVVVLQEILGDERLRLLNVAADDGHRTIRADLLITDRLATIVARHGRALYADFDREARRLLVRGKEEKDPRLLEEVGRSYPVAEVAPDSLLALGQLYAAQKKPAEAAYSYKRLLGRSADDAQRARALIGLARAYEDQRLWVPARDTYLEALARFGGLRMDDWGAEEPLGSAISRVLDAEPYVRMTADRSEPSLPVPLVRRWARTMSGPTVPLAAQGVPPSAESSRIFLVQGTELVSIDSTTGATHWSAELGERPVWAGYLADKLVAATKTRLLGLSLDKGMAEWVFDQAGPQGGRPGDNPFAKEDAGPNAADPAAGRFHGFQIVGGRLVCLRGDREPGDGELQARELLAIDGDTGLVDWSFSPASGTINPLMLAGPHWIILQTRKPNVVLVLETKTGRRKAEFARPDGEEWLRAPLPIDDDHVAIVPDRRTVALFDLRRGSPSWKFQESEQLPRNGAPRLFGNAERLLVLHDGTELIRLDPATGTKRWSRPLGSDDLSECPEATALDGDRFYWASDQKLGATTLADGSLAWRRDLSGPTTGWSIALTESCVMAYPAPASSSTVEGEGLPLVFRRRDTGALVQRLKFPVSIADVAVRLAPRGVLVATRGGLWSLGERKTLVASQSPR